MILTERMLCFDCMVCSQWLTHTHGIFGHHTEIVLFAFLQITHCCGCSMQEAAHFLPTGNQTKQQETTEKNLYLAKNF